MNVFMGPLANLGPVLGFLRIRSFQALPALRDLEELLTERTQESERVPARPPTRRDPEKEKRVFVETSG